MKKKLLSILFTCILLSSLSACGNSGKTDDGSDSSAKNAIENTADDAADNETEKEAGTVQTGSATIEPQVICDQDGVKITADSLEKTGDQGDFDLNLTIENNTDKKIAISKCGLFVNDMMLGYYDGPASIDISNRDFSLEYNTYVAAGMDAGEAEPGGTVETSIDISGSDLEEAKINSIGKIELMFNVFNTESCTGLFRTDLAEIKTSEYENASSSETPEGTELFNQDGIRILAYGFTSAKEGKGEYEYETYRLNFYAENNTDSDISIQVPETNELEENMQSLPYNEIKVLPAGKKAFWQSNVSLTVEKYDMDETTYEAVVTEQERTNLVLSINKTIWADASNENIGYSTPVPLSSLE